VSLHAGTQVLRVVMDGEDYIDFQWLVIDPAPPAGAPSGGFGGTPLSIPGQIEAENYDLGGPGIGYADSTPGNEQGVAVYRGDDVDIKESAAGGYAVGWTTAGEWLAYTVDVERDGFYTIEARVGSALPDRTFHIETDRLDVTGPLAVPQLNDWDQYESVTAAGIYLHRGVQVLRMVMGAEDFIDFQGLAITADQ
jgi:hypothetical protein